PGTASETVFRRPSGWAADERLSSGAYRSVQSRSATSRVISTRPAGIVRRPGGRPSGVGTSSCGRSCVRSFVPVAMSELEVDERSDPAGAERRDDEEYDG